MANTILTPGQTGAQNCDQPAAVADTTQYLEKDKHLGEFDTEVDKNLARENIGVYPKESVYTKTESDLATNKAVQESMQQHLNTPDPHGILSQVEQDLLNYIKRDGTTAFTAPQTGVDPISDFHLTTKKWVTNLINQHINAVDPHKILPQVKTELALYAKIADVYLKSDVYNIREIDYKLGDFVRRDGSTPFTKPQYGIDPTVDSHLSTKRYVDMVMQSHLTDIDPHGFIALLNQRLAQYYRKSEVYNKAEVYNRTQVDAIIRSLVVDAAKEAIQDALSEYDSLLGDKVKAAGFVKNDGTTPFIAPQKGVEAVDDTDLVIYSQLKELEKELPIWYTSGPSMAEVGFVTNGYEFAPQYSFQDLMDLIFYGSTVTVVSPEWANIGSTVQVDCGVHGNSSELTKAELFQNDVLIATFYKEDLVNGHYFVTSKPLYEDTTFHLVCTYFTDRQKEATDITKLAYGIFTGTLKKWQPGNTVTWDQLQEQIASDPENNTMTEGIGKDVTSITQHYNFQDSELRHIFLAVQSDYPDIKQMTTITQQFTRDAFDVIDIIPLQIPNVVGNTLYRFYIFKQAQAQMDLDVTFVFDQSNE